MILGVAGVIHPLTLGNINNVDLIVCVISGIALQVFAINHKISRWEGGFLFLLYCAYVGFLLW
jgi:Ca2+/Na+ antiporter